MKLYLKNMDVKKRASLFLWSQLFFRAFNIFYFLYYFPYFSNLFRSLKMWHLFQKNIVPLGWLKKKKKNFFNIFFINRIYDIFTNWCEWKKKMIQFLSPVKAFSSLFNIFLMNPRFKKFIMRRYNFLKFKYKVKFLHKSIKNLEKKKLYLKPLFNMMLRIKPH